MTKTKTNPEGTFVVDFSKRQMALVMLAASNYLSDSTNLSELLTTIKTDENELDDLRQHLTEFFENF